MNACSLTIETTVLVVATIAVMALIVAIGALFVITWRQSDRILHLEEQIDDLERHDIRNRGAYD